MKPIQNLFLNIKNWFLSLSRLTRFTILLVLIVGGIGAFLQAVYTDDSPIVTSIAPAFQRGVPENSNFTITFKQVVPQTIQDKVAISIEPKVAGSFFFLNNNQLYFQIAEKMELNTQYTLRVLYEERSIYEHPFLTNEFTALERAEQLRQQSLEDQKFSEQQQKQEEAFPWTFKMPISTDEYTIVYDYEVEEFRIRLKVVEPQNQEIKTNLQNKALFALEGIDVDPDEWGYYFLYLE